MFHNIYSQINSDYQDKDYLIEMEAQAVHFKCLEISRDEKRKYRLKYPNHPSSEIVRLARKNIYRRISKESSKLRLMRMGQFRELVNGS